MSESYVFRIFFLHSNTGCVHSYPLLGSYLDIWYAGLRHLVSLGIPYSIRRR